MRSLRSLRSIQGDMGRPRAMATPAVTYALTTPSEVSGAFVEGGTVTVDPVSTWTANGQPATVTSRQFRMIYDDVPQTPQTGTSFSLALVEAGTDYVLQERALIEGVYTDWSIGVIASGTVVLATITIDSEDEPSTAGIGTITAGESHADIISKMTDPAGGDVANAPEASTNGAGTVSRTVTITSGSNPVVADETITILLTYAATGATNITRTLNAGTVVSASALQPPTVVGDGTETWNVTAGTNGAELDIAAFFSGEQLSFDITASEIVQDDNFGVGIGPGGAGKLYLQTDTLLNTTARAVTLRCQNSAGPVTVQLTIEIEPFNPATLLQRYPYPDYTILIGDPSDLSLNYQNADRTLPVTANDQIVRSFDMLGSPPYYFAQWDASNGRTWKENGVLPYWQRGHFQLKNTSDGTDASVQIGPSFDLLGSQKSANTVSGYVASQMTASTVDGAGIRRAAPNGLLELRTETLSNGVVMTSTAEGVGSSEWAIFGGSGNGIDEVTISSPNSSVTATLPSAINNIARPLTHGGRIRQNLAVGSAGDTSAFIFALDLQLPEEVRGLCLDWIFQKVYGPPIHPRFSTEPTLNASTLADRDVSPADVITIDTGVIDLGTKSAQFYWNGAPIADPGATYTIPAGVTGQFVMVVTATNPGSATNTRVLSATVGMSNRGKTGNALAATLSTRRFAQDGVLLEFSGPVTVSKFHSGPFSGDVNINRGTQTLTGYYPAPALAPYFQPRQVNGSMLNPAAGRLGGDDVKIAFDGWSKPSLYDGNLDQGQKLPLSPSNKDTLVIGVSDMTPSRDSKTRFITSHFVPVTFSTEPIYWDSIRPPATFNVVANKPFLRLADADLSFLPAMASTANAPTVDEVREFVGRYRCDIIGNFSRESLTTLNSWGVYGREIQTMQRGCFVWIASDTPTAAERDLVVSDLLAHGLDRYGALLTVTGDMWPADGGHHTGRKAEMLFAAAAFDNAAMKALVASNGWQEDRTCLYVDAETITISQSNTPRNWNPTYGGGSFILQSVVGLSEGDIFVGGTSGFEALVKTINPRKTPPNTVTVEYITDGTPVVGEAITSGSFSSTIVSVTSTGGAQRFDPGMYNGGVHPAPSYIGNSLNGVEVMSARFGTHNYEFTGNFENHPNAALGMLAMGLKADWGHDAFFDQMHRHYTMRTQGSAADPWRFRGGATPDYDAVQAGGTRTFDEWEHAMYAAHWNTYYSPPWA